MSFDTFVTVKLGLQQKFINQNSCFRKGFTFLMCKNS